MLVNGCRYGCNPGVREVPHLDRDRDGTFVGDSDYVIAAVGSGTAYPDQKPAPFIVSRDSEGEDFATVVTESMFSYCGTKIKIDTDWHLGDEAATVWCDGEAIGQASAGE
ncbi:MAG: hypothetical protein OXI87_00920 [Albidovulum sp.]|nr:hypothetical protein [Albidovulum sp.]